MNKWVKRGLWAVGIVVAVTVGLSAVGINMMSNAEDFAKEHGIKDPIAIDQSDSILCTGSMIGVIVADGVTKDSSVYPVCVNIFGDKALGQWDK